MRKQLLHLSLPQLQLKWRVDNWKDLLRHGRNSGIGK